MKAIQAHEFGAPEVLQLDEVPDPVPGPGEVVIDIKAAGGQSGRHLYARRRLCDRAEPALHAGR